MGLEGVGNLRDGKEAGDEECAEDEVSKHSAERVKNAREQDPAGASRVSHDERDGGDIRRQRAGADRGQNAQPQRRRRRENESLAQEASM